MTMADPTEKSLIDAIMMDGASKKAEIVQKKPRKRPAKRVPKKPKTGVVDDWSEVKEVKHRLPDDVAKWQTRHWRTYFDDHVERKYGLRTWPGIAAVASAVKDVRRKLTSRTGVTCSPAMLREYIDTFFESAADQIVKKHGNCVITMLGWDTGILAFSGRIDVKPKEVEEVRTEPVAASASITLEEIDAKSKVSFRGVLLSYGLVLATFWAVKAKGTAVEKAVTAVERAAAQAVKTDRRFWINIVSSTERFGPYPTWMPWTDVNGVTVAVEKAVGVKLKRINVGTCDENKSLAPLKDK